ncbi:MAG: hypothetical protein ABF289_10435 [Clostridiales bacterium]
MPKYTKDIFNYVKADFFFLIKLKFVYLSIMFGMLITLVTSIIITMDHQSYEILLNIPFKVLIFSFEFLIFGIYITRKDNLKYIRKIADVEPSKYFIFVFSKFVNLLIFVSIFTVLNLFIVQIFLIRDNLFKEIFFESIGYVFLYWIIPYIVCGSIGISLAVINRPLVLITMLGIFFWAVFSPLNVYLVKILSIIFKGNVAGKVVVFFERTTDTLCIMPYFQDQFNSINPYSIDGVKILDNIMILIAAILFFYIITIFEFDPDDRRNYIGYGLLLSISLCVIIFIYYPRELFEFMHKENASDKVYYSDNKRVGYENGDNFALSKYDIKIDEEDILKIDLNMEAEALDDNIRRINFIFYHGFEINKIKVNNGKNFDYEFENDQLKIILDRPLDNGDKINISLEYEGIGSESFINFKNEIMLPAYFPWLPRVITNGDNGYIKTTYGNIPASINYKSEYLLTYNGDGKIYTNIDYKSGNVWEGEALSGLTVVRGKIKSNREFGYRNIYPTYEIGITNYTGYFSRQAVEELDLQKEKFKVKNKSEIKDIFYIPLEDILDSNILMDMGDHLIIALDKSYNADYYTRIFYEELPEKLNMATNSLLSKYNKPDLEYSRKKEVFLETYNYYKEVRKVPKTARIKNNYNANLNDQVKDVKKKDDIIEDTNEYNELMEVIELKRQIKSYIDQNIDEGNVEKLDNFYLTYFNVLKAEKFDFSKIQSILGGSKK